MAVLVLSALSGAVFAQDDCAAGRALLDDGKLDQAAAKFASAIKQLTDKGLAELSAAEWMEYTTAHRMLMAISYRQAMDSGKLDARQLKDAKHWYELAMGTQAVRVVGFGEPIKLADHLVPGKINIVDFFSIYCGPCVSMGVYIDALAEQNEDVVLVKVDINRPGKKGIDWGSPLAKQFGLQSIPHLKIYGPDLKLKVEDTRENEAAARKEVIEMIKDQGIM